MVWSDQGLQFTSKLFNKFSKEWGFQHITSSPTYPQSNGNVEAAVKAMKKIIQASWIGSCLDEGKLTRALLQYCNTPSRRDQLSPAQKLFGHPIQDVIPAHRKAYAPQWQKSAEETDVIAALNKDQVEQTTIYMQGIYQRSMLVPVLPSKTHTQSYGIFMEKLSILDPIGGMYIMSKHLVDVS